jgi:segregation and condensation protein A
VNFKINDFDGPLDLLWHLIKVNKMDIYDINIEEITKEYLNYINNNKDLSIDNNSEYLVMASELIHLKSKMLLNKKDEEDDSEYEINNEEELQRRLLEYEKIKGIANNFKDLEEKRSEVFTKLPSNLEEYRTDNNIINSDVSINDLIKAFESFLKRQKDSEPLNTTVTKKEISVEERCLSIKNFIHQKGKVNFTALFDDVSKPYVIVTFLSILNMTKNKEIIISQNKNFGDIFIEESMI